MMTTMPQMTMRMTTWIAMGDDDNEFVAPTELCVVCTVNDRDPIALVPCAPLYA